MSLDKILNSQQDYMKCSYNAFKNNYDASENYSDFYTEGFV